MARKLVYRFQELIARKERIDQRSYYQLDIVEKTGLTHHAVRMLLQGRRDKIGLEEISIWCEFLDCEPGDLYAYIDVHEVPHSEDEDEEEDTPTGVLA